MGYYKRRFGFTNSTHLLSCGPILLLSPWGQMRPYRPTSIERVNIPHCTSLIKPHLTLSMGLACWHPDPSLTPDTLTAMADQALYQAKQGGRDRYCLSAPFPP